MKIALRCFAIALMLLIPGSSMAKKSYKAGAPVFYKDRNNRAFGSIFDSKLLKGCRGSDDSAHDSDEDLGVTVPQDTNLNQRERLWNAAFTALKGFSMDEVDKSGPVWLIRTSRSKVDKFDNTGACQYVVTVKIDAQGEVTVEITSVEDSPVRLSILQDTTRNRIVEAAQV
ncbi:MAG: hypothetical protein LBJ77_01500 [Holosporales bacterium]|jgi:hypothetical protein|nr:hypothetical protein [Holosporales bacterium]